MHLIAALLVAALAIVACTGETSVRTRPDNLSKIAASIDPVAGITQAQAEVIAEWYFQHHISGCGAAAEPIDKGNNWEITPLIGYAATPDPNPIIISKDTGAVSWKRGPSFETPAQMLGSQP